MPDPPPAADADPGPSRAEPPGSARDSRARWRTVLGRTGIALTVGACIVAIGVLNPRPPDPVTTDRLGPEYGEDVAGYLNRARDSLDGADSEKRWALVSFTDYVPNSALRTHIPEIRISEVLYQVPLPRVATPLLSVQVPANDQALARSAQDAAWQLWKRLQEQTPDARTRTVLETSLSRLRADCACSPGAIVRATLPELRELSAHTGIRAVEALPPDAVPGRFAVRPLRPDSTTTVEPPPDDGPVPAP